MKKIRIPASPQDPNPKKRFSQQVIVILPEDLENDYDAAAKEFPDGLPLNWIDPIDEKKKKIDWISNFGLTKGGEPADKLPEGKKYSVLLPRPRNKRYVYFDGASVKDLPTEPSATDPDFLEAIFRLADPPTGMT